MITEIKDFKDVRKIFKDKPPDKIKNKIGKIRISEALVITAKSGVWEKVWKDFYIKEVHKDLTGPFIILILYSKHFKKLKGKDVPLYSVVFERCKGKNGVYTVVKEVKKAEVQ